MFLLRSADPPASAAIGRPVVAVGRLGKRISFELGPGPRPGEPARLWLLLHLMIAGRLHWKERSAPLTRRVDLAAFDFSTGSLLLTEAGTKRRAMLHVVEGRAGLAAHGDELKPYFSGKGTLRFTAAKPIPATTKSRTRFAAPKMRLLRNPSEKISQLGRRFSTAILPMYSS